MKTINKSEQLNTSTVLVQVTSVMLIMLAYLTSRSLIFVAGAICFLFLLTNVGWEQKYSLMFFLFSFCWVFTYKAAQTSIFMLLRIAILLSVIIYDRRKINIDLIMKCLILIFYLTVISLGNLSAGVKYLLNIILWLLIGYFMQATVDSNNILPISRSFVNGVILSGIIGMNLQYIPNLQREMVNIEILGYGGVAYNRFCGLFNDPNLYTIIVCVSLWAIYYEFTNEKVSISEYGIKSILLSFLGAMTMSKSCILLVALYWIYVIFAINNIKMAPKLVISAAILIGGIYFIVDNPEWFYNVIERFTRGGRQGTVTYNDITSGRTEIWKWYLEYLYNSNTWVWGNGLASPLPRGRAAHNTILQLLFVVGFVGTLIVYNFFKFMYKKTTDGNKIVGTNKVGVYALIFVFATLFFLDGFYLEIYYYMLPLCFVYMKLYGEAEEHFPLDS